MAKILIFDCDPLNRERLMELARSCGHHVLVASTPELGFRKIKAEPLDLIMADLSAPEMRETGFIRRLRETAPGLPIIFYSSGPKQDRPKNQTKGSRWFKVYPKPTRPEELQEAIGDALGVSSLGASFLPKDHPAKPDKARPKRGDLDRPYSTERALVREELGALSDLTGKSESELKTMVFRLAGLARFGMEIQTEIRPDTLLESASQILLQIFQAQYSGIILLDPESGIPAQKVTQGVTDKDRAHLDFSSPIFTRTMARGQACRADKPGGNQPTCDLHAGLPGRHPEVRDWVGTPIATASQVYGWAYVAHGAVRDRFNNQDELLLKVIGTKLGLAYQNLLQAEALEAARSTAERTSTALALANEELQTAGAELRAINDELEKRVLERTDQLRALTGELIQSEERERRRIAKILHDELQQQLAGARMQVDLAQRQRDPKIQKKNLQKAVEIIKESLELSRRLSHDLSLVVLHEEGLAAALAWLAEWMEERHGLSVEVTCDPVAAALNEDSKVALFQAIRELLFNVSKHAGVDTAEVQLRLTEGQHVEVAVIDPGRGIDPGKGKAIPPTKAGFGHFSIRERLRALGGSMEVESAPGKGTKVRLTAPLAG